MGTIWSSDRAATRRLREDIRICKATEHRIFRKARWPIGRWANRLPSIPSRRSILKAGAAACGLCVVAPMINRGRFQAFAQSGATYSARAIDLVEGSLVIDMLSALGGERWESMWSNASAMGES